MMKKSVKLICLLLLFTSSHLIAQTIEKEQSKSKTVEFSKKSGAFLKKEFQELGSFSNIKFTNIYFTDILTNEKASALKVETSYYSSSLGSTEYSGTLDPDELDACLKCLNHIKTNCIGTTPELYTEMIYKTRDGLSIGAYYSIEDNKKQQWVVFIQPESYTYKSLKAIKEEDLGKIISVIEQSKQTLLLKK